MCSQRNDRVFYVVGVFSSFEVLSRFSSKSRGLVSRQHFILAYVPHLRRSNHTLGLALSPVLTNPYLMESGLYLWTNCWCDRFVALGTFLFLHHTLTHHSRCYEQTERLYDVCLHYLNMEFCRANTFVF